MQRPLPLLGIAPRVRKSPFYEATRRWGAQAYSVYNHTLMPLWYESPEADFWNLIEKVTVWDVACERQLEVSGPDAARFAQYLTCRDLSGFEVGQAKYVLLTDEQGGIVNDPIALRLAPDRFWFSLADSDALLWAKGLAAAGGWDVALGEPDVSPLQVQGPRSVDLIGDLFGPQARELRYYRFYETELDGMPLLVSRTGWSGERGYEVFLRDGRFGDTLWERLMEAGKPYGVAPACPSTIRRTEAGILSYGNDMGLTENPFEIGLARLVSFGEGLDYLARPALEALAAHPPARRLAGIEIEGDPIPGNEEHWPVFREGERVGHASTVVHSPRLKKNIALALVATATAAEGTRLTVACADGERGAVVVPMPFHDPKKTLVTAA